MMRDLLAKPLVVVTGKGGVGKSTVAAALAVAAASEGRRTIVAEVAARDDVSRMAAGEDGAGGRAPVAERAVADGLHHISIDPEAALEEYLRDQLPRGIADVLAASRSFGYLTAATPGLRELLTIGKVWELAQPDRRTPGAHPYDLVVLDAPATGHGVAVLEAPGTFAGAARKGPIARQGGIIHEMVADPEQTAIIAVSAPEEMPVNETLALQAALAEGLGQRLAAVVVNGMLPRRFAGADLTRIDGASSRAARAVRMQAARSAAQRAQLARLRRGVRTPVRTLPFVFAPSLGPAEVRRLAGELLQ